MNNTDLGPLPLVYLMFFVTFLAFRFSFLIDVINANNWKTIAKILISVSILGVIFNIVILWISLSVKDTSWGKPLFIITTLTSLYLIAKTLIDCFKDLNSGTKLYNGSCSLTVTYPSRAPMNYYIILENKITLWVHNKKFFELSDGQTRGIFDKPLDCPYKTEIHYLPNLKIALNIEKLS